MTDPTDGKSPKFSDFLRQARDFAQDQTQRLADQWQQIQQPPHPGAGQHPGHYPPHPGGQYPPHPGGQYPPYPGGQYPPYPGGQYPPYPGGAYPPYPGVAYPPNVDAHLPYPEAEQQPSASSGMDPLPRMQPPGSQPSQPSAPFESADTTGWVTYTILDQQFQVPARTMRIPPGWHAEGHVQWNMALRDSPVQLSSIASSPDGSAFVDFPSRLDFITNVGAPWQPSGTGRICMPHDSVHNLTLNYIVPVLAPKAQVTSVQAVHDVQQRWGMDLSANQRLGVRFEACEVTVDHADEQGQAWTELWWCLGATNPPNSPFLQHALVLIRLGSHRENHAEMLPTLIAIAQSTTETAQWGQVVSQVFGQVVQQLDAELTSFNQQAWQNIQANQARSAQLMSGMVQSHIQRQQESWSQPSAAAQFGNALAGQVEVPDPNSSYGNTQYASSSAGYVWQNQNGDLIETDDPNFDPRPNSHDTWNVVRRYGE